MVSDRATAKQNRDSQRSARNQGRESVPARYHGGGKSEVAQLRIHWTGAARSSAEPVVLERVQRHLDHWPEQAPGRRLATMEGRTARYGAQAVNAGPEPRNSLPQERGHDRPGKGSRTVGAEG